MFFLRPIQWYYSHSDPIWPDSTFKYQKRSTFMNSFQVWELSRLYPETSTKLYVHESGFRTVAASAWHCLKLKDYPMLEILSFLLSEYHNTVLGSPPSEYLQCPPMNTLTNKRRRKLRWRWSTDAEFLEEIHTKVLRVFLLAIHSHRYSFALRFLFLQIHATSNTVSRVPILCTIKEKGGILDRKPYSLLYGLRNPYRNLKSENS